MAAPSWSWLEDHPNQPVDCRKWSLVPYDAGTCLALEAAMVSGAPGHTMMGRYSPASSIYRCFVAGREDGSPDGGGRALGGRYEVNFATMEQRNLQTGNLRPVTRQALSAAPAQAPEGYI